MHIEPNFACGNNRLSAMRSKRRLLLGGVAALAICSIAVLAQVTVTNTPPQYGPYNGVFLADGIGFKMPLADAHDTVLRADLPWTLYCWVRTSEPVEGRELVAGLGSVSAENPRYLGLDAGKVMLWMGRGNEFSGTADLRAGEWHLLAATFDGSRFHLYADGAQVGSGALLLGNTNPLLQMAPSASGANVTVVRRHFGGQIAAFTMLRRALSDADVRQLHESPPNFSLILFEEGSKPWPLQTRGQAGYRAPQDPSTWPRSRAPFSAPTILKRAPVGASLAETGAGEWSFEDGWNLREAPKVDVDGTQLSLADYRATGWMRATVPGTVLTTMIDDGVYPDPDFGLNNLAIPESLNKQDYWYRNEFTAPASLQAASGEGRHVELTFQGVNYEATVWLNGTRLGEIRGAFNRGTFDVTSVLKVGKNVLAVRISPPPHPGIPHEQSVLGGPGENGGAMVLDGPSFMATEGWDWIPAIRDRDSGIWQPVMLRVTRNLS